MIIQLIVIKPNKVNNDINTNNNNNIIVIIKLIINENEVNDKKKIINVEPKKSDTSKTNFIN